MEANEKIRRLAYKLWESEGRPDGRDKEHWFHAERILANQAKSNQEDKTFQRVMSIRWSDVLEIANIIKQADIPSLRQTIRYYPLTFLGDGIDAYRYAFDNASILYAGTAVELALLALLKDDINLKRSKNPKLRIDLNWLIENAGILLDDEHKKLSHCIRKVRNCYIHYENIIAHLGWMQDVTMPDIIERMEKDPFNDADAGKLISFLWRMMEEYPKSIGMLPIRFEHLERNPEIIPFIENQTEQYIKWLPSAWQSKQGKITEEEFMHLYGIETYDALQCLNWTFKVVRKLGLI